MQYGCGSFISEVGKCKFNDALGILEHCIVGPS